MLPLFIMLHLLLHSHARRHLVLYRPLKQLARFLFIRRFLVHDYIQAILSLLHPASRNFPINPSDMGISFPSSIRNIDDSLVITHKDPFSIDNTTGWAESSTSCTASGNVLSRTRTFFELQIIKVEFDYSSTITANCVFWRGRIWEGINKTSSSLSIFLQFIADN